MAWALCAGQGIYWQGFGSGARRVLAIHCGLAHSGAWRSVASALGNDLALTAFDLPGHGESDPWDGQGDYGARCVEVAGAFLKEPMDVIGHSMGALVALRLALRQPDKIRSLVLIEPVLFAAARGFAEYDQHETEMAPYYAALEDGDLAAAVRAFTDVWGSGVPMREAQLKSAVSRIHLVTAARGLNYDLDHEVLQDGALDGLRMPVLILRGAKSPAIISRVAEELSRRLAIARVRTVEGAGHMLPLTHPVEVAALIGPFLSGAASRG